MNFTEDEIHQLQSVLRHRTHIVSFFLPRYALKEIQANIDLLEKDTKELNHIHRSENGRASFCIPGGWKGHKFSIEFAYIKDKYTIIFHNRGEGCNDERLHLFFTINGKKYFKTSAVIEVSNKEVLKDDAFLSKLIFGSRYNYYDKDEIYDHIYRKLIESANGKIQRDEIDETLEELAASQDEDTALKLMRQSRHYRRPHRYGTCGESNSLEDHLASPLVQKKLRFFTIGVMANEVMQYSRQYPNDKRGYELLRLVKQNF